MIQIIRLISGEEILTEYDKNQATNPIAMVPTQDGKIAFQPYIPYSKNESFYLKDSSIVWQIEPTEELEQKYKEMTGAVMTPPKQKIIV